MVCGYDIFHKKRCKSMLAFNATINITATRQWQTSVMQEEGNEIASGLEEIVSEALQAFKTQNKRYPERLVVYRDGVSDSQKPVVPKSELSQIKQAFARD